MSDQWRRSQDAFSETAAAQVKADEASSEARGLMHAIAKLKEEADEALDEINLVRRETKMLRDDAERAKQRADSSADAAERAADQIQREVESTKSTSTGPG